MKKFGARCYCAGVKWELRSEPFQFLGPNRHGKSDDITHLISTFPLRSTVISLAPRGMSALVSFPPGQRTQI